MSLFAFFARHFTSKTQGRQKKTTRQKGGRQVNNKQVSARRSTAKRQKDTKQKNAWFLFKKPNASIADL